MGIDPGARSQQDAHALQGAALRCKHQRSHPLALGMFWLGSLYPWPGNHCHVLPCFDHGTAIQGVLDHLHLPITCTSKQLDIEILPVEEFPIVADQGCLVGSHCARELGIFYLLVTGSSQHMLLTCTSIPHETSRHCLQ